MAAVHSSDDRLCDVSIHLSDTEFTSRIDYADAYVLPTTSTTAAASADVTTLPMATLVSPWLLVSPSVCDTEPSSSRSVAVTAAGTALSPAVEAVPLAWRCPSCDTLEVEQLYWRRPQRSKVSATDEASTAAAVRAALARSMRLNALSPALQAKLERHRWRRERREEMRWRSLHINAHCRSCFLCPRCGGQGSLPFSEAAQVIGTSTTKSTAASSSLSPTAANVLRSTQSVSSLDIRLTSDMQYYAMCMCCQWHSYRAFPTMEQLLGYLDAVMGDEKAETLREHRAAQRSFNTALRAGLPGLLGGYPDLEDHVSSQHRQQQQATVSQAAWDKFRHLRSAHMYDRSAGPPSHSSTPPPPQQQQLNDKMVKDAIMHLHPALALEQLRHQEQQRQEAARALPLLQGVSQAAPQTVRVVDFAREAVAQLQAAQDGEAKDRTPLSESPPAHRSAPSASITAGSADKDVEVNLIARTQQCFLGLPLEAVDTRQQGIQTWMQRYQPAAVVAQERKTAAAAAAAAVTSSSALMHTPTSAYLHSVLLREQDRPLGLPAYYIPRVRKELLTALVWRLPPASATRKPPTAEQSPPCTRLVLLDRHALSDEEVRQVCQHWVDERTAQVERHERKRRSELEQQKGAGSTTTAGRQWGNGDGDGGLDSDGGDEEDDDDDEGVERPKGGVSQGSMHPARAQHAPPQQSIKKSVPSKLPLPLFLDGTDFSALSCLPFLEYVRSGGGSNARPREWQFRLMNLHMMHDVYLTGFEVLRTVIAPSCAVGAPHARPSPFLLSASAACVTVQLSSPSVPAVELPVVLTPRCSPEERAAALAAVLQGGDDSRVGDAGPSPPLSIPPILTMGITTPPIRLRELHITLRDTSATQAGEPSSPPMRTPLRYLELLVEVLTALSDVEHMRPQYHTVRYGLAVTLSSC